ncbi:GAF domain-containing protein [Hahella sp. KA22]|uniref:GAF domain-containing protein n=1 Tax=Hahella sp. KA22 TaxID=1628392 RepID=UPI001F4D3F24|nr:GAF domain-containing protein [Hahella sp. KA22]
MFRTKRRRAKHSIQFHLAMAFIALLLTFGAVLGWFHHQKMSDIFITSTHHLFDRVATDVSGAFYAGYSPVSATVKLLSLSPLMQESDLEGRLQHLPSLVAVLRAQPQVAALSVGYADSEYFIIRNLNSEYLLKRFDAPLGAHYVVDNIERSDGANAFMRFYYDEALNRIGEKDLGYTNYDPTVRPWYRLAAYTRDVTTTQPYLYYFIGKVGVTAVKQDPASGAVFAADITLESLSQTLQENRVSPSSQMLIYTHDGSVIGSLDPATIVVDNDPEKLRILQLADLKSPEIRDFIARQKESAGSDFFFDSHGERWLGVTRPVNLVGFTANLMILAPESELLAEAYEITNQSGIITLVIVILALPFALFFANQIARPLRNLAEETRRIQRLDFVSPLTVKSSISDIDSLASAIELMKNTISRFTGLTRTLAEEQDFERLLHEVSLNAMHMSQAEGSLVYLIDPEEEHLWPACFQTRHGAKTHHAMPSLRLSDQNIAFVQATYQEDLSVIAVTYDSAARCGTHESLLNHVGSERLSAVAMPLKNRQGRRIGLLCLLFQPDEENGLSAPEERLAFVRALAGLCALSIDSGYRASPRKQAV